MAKSYYETLGVSPTARSVEIKAAYRKLVLKHHPDKSADPSAPQIFRGITEAFEVLGDPRTRKRYDESLAAEARQRREYAERKQIEEEQMRQRTREAVRNASRFVEETDPTATRPQFTTNEITEMVKRLSILFSRQRFADCEILSRQIIQLDPRRALPYAVLGDISRARGSIAEAMKMYSYALQMDPTNALFLQRYEELMDRAQIEEGRGHRVRVEPQEKRTFAVLAIVVMTLLSCVYILVSPEAPVMTGFPLVSTWTIGIISMLFIAGASAGAALSVGNLIDRVDAYSNRRISPTMLLGLVAIFSFPASALIYALRGLTQKAFSITTTRLMTSVALITASLALAAAASSTGISFEQVALWGGNLVYLAAMAGWTLADSLRR